MGIGSRIKELRKRKGINQAQLAAAMGITRQAVSRWELEAQNPTKSKMEALAKILGVRPVDITGITIYPDTVGGNEEGEINRTAVTIPVEMSQVVKDEDGHWGPEANTADTANVVPLIAAKYKSKAIAVISPGVKLKDGAVDIPRGAVATVDAGTPVKAGKLALIMIYGAPAFAYVFYAGNADVILDTEKGRVSLTKDEQAYSGFEIIGPVVDVRINF